MDLDATIVIDRACRPDADEILTLQKLAYQSEAELYGVFDIPPLRQTVAEMESDIERQVVLRAVNAGRIIGSVRAYAARGTCHIGRVIVHPDCQNRGLGRQLMAAIEREFPDVARYELFTGQRSERNLHFYRKLGYRPCRTERLSDVLSLVFLEKPAPSA
jgi:ribosomal protein S18 acetylase RimI-like enzyme